MGIFAALFKAVGWKGIITGGIILGIVLGVVGGGWFIYNEGKQHEIDAAAQRALQQKRDAAEERQKIQGDVDRLDDPKLLDKLRHPN